MLLLFALWRHLHLRPAPEGGAPAAAVPAAVPAAPQAGPRPPAQKEPNAAPLPSVLALARVARPGPDARPIEDRFAKAATVWETETAAGKDRQWVQRIRLVRTDLKYPLVRLEETLRRVPTPTGSRDFLLQQIAMVGDHLLVRTTPGTRKEFLGAQVSRFGGSVRRRLHTPDTYLVAIPAGHAADLPAALASLQTDGIAHLAEPDYLVFATTTPNDPGFPSLWGLHNTGATGTADADIDAPEAWSITTGSRTVTVGVIDTGIDYNHPDLAANIWSNPGEIAGNRVDDDHNGHIDDVHGWDFCNDDANPMDDHGHGTHCAGTIGAVGNNGIGVAGVNWAVSIAALKFLSAGGSGAISDAIDAVNYANRMGFDLTSNSWGGGGYSALMEEAISAAGTAGYLFVAAAGNSALNTDTAANYPSGYDCENILSVAATDANDALAYFSNHGVESVDLAAPGVDIYSTAPNAGYTTLSGTSMATPHVAGAAALLKSAHPQFGAPLLKTVLLASVDPITSLQGVVSTGGRLNLATALAAPEHLIATSGDFSATGSVGGPVAPGTHEISLYNLTGHALSFTASVDVSWVGLSTTAGTVPADGSVALTLSLLPAVERLPAGKASATVTITENGSGRTIVRHVNLQIIPPVVYAESLNTAPGWSMTGQWQFGAPRGSGGAVGFPDPAAAATGTNVYGINLAGDYSTNATGPDYLTTTAFDLSGYANTLLRFRRWLNVESAGWAVATIDLSTDGTTWTTVWSSSGPVLDSQWTTQQLDLSAHADGQPTVYLRWGHQTFAGAWSLSGWNIDDVELLAAPPRAITFDPLPPTAETAGSIAARLRIDPAPEAPLLITLTASHPETAAVPASVTVPAGSTQFPLTIGIRNDALLNGSRSIALRPSAESYIGRVTSLVVNDDETAALALTLPATATEGQAPITGTLTCSRAPDAPITVALSATPAGLLTLPATVALPAGSTSTVFAIHVPDNARIDRTVPVALTATVPGWGPGNGTITVADNDPTTLAVTLPSDLSESDGTLAGAGQIRISGTLTTALSVALASSDTTEVVVPATVTIPAGQTSATFNLTILNDGIADGAQVATISATAANFTSGQASVVIADAAVDHFTFDLVPSPQTTGVGFAVRIVARDAANNIAAGFRGTANLTAAQSGHAIAMAPTITTAFDHGAWTGTATLTSAGANTVLSCTANSASGKSNPFAVQKPPVTTLALANTDLTYAPATGRLYASTAEGTIVPIDAAAATAGTPLAVSTTGISRLVASTDGTQLYAVHESDQKILRLPTATMAPAEDIVATDSSQPIHSLVPVPGRPLSVAAALRPYAYSSGAGTLCVFHHGAKAANSVANSGNNFASFSPAGGAGQLYGVDASYENQKLYRIAVDDAGATVTDSRVSFFSGYTTIAADGRHIVGTQGRVVDAEANRCLGTLPTGGPACVDAAARRIFVVGNDSGGYQLQWYDLDTLEQLGRLALPGLPDSPTTLLRWGARGLAFRTTGQIHIIQGDFVPTAGTADLDIRVSATPSPATAGQQFSYTIRVRNLGRMNAESVVVSDLLPAELAYLGGRTSHGAISLQGREVTAQLGSIASGEEALIRLDVLAANSGLVTNTVQVVSATTPDLTTINNQAVAIVTVGDPAVPVLRQAGIGATAIASNGAALVVSLSSASPLQANAVATFDPASLAITKLIHVGSNPGRLVLTDDGHHAHVALDGAFAMRPVDLTSGVAGATVWFERTENQNPFLATDFAPLAGSTTSVAVSRSRQNSTTNGNVAIYDGATARPRTSAAFTTTSAWLARDASAAGALELCPRYGENALWTCAATDTGLLLRQSGATGLSSSSGDRRIKRLGHLLVYPYDGSIVDTRSRTVVRVLGALGAFATDADNHRLYAIDPGYYQSTVTAYDTDTWLPVASLPLPSFASYASATDLVRWGRHGLALITATGDLYSFESVELVPHPPLRVVAPDTVTEGDGVLTGAARVELVHPADDDLTVSLVSSAPAVLSVPATVLIRKGEKAATFDLALADNPHLNGTRHVTITPTAEGPLTLRPATVSVCDDEVGVITLALPAAVAEAGDNLIGAGRVTISAAAGEPVAIDLESRDTSELVVPKRVVIPAGETSVQFDVATPDDDVLDGPQTVEVTASTANWIPDSATVEVEDSDPLTLTLTLPASTTESSGLHGTISLAAKTLVPLQIRLTSSDTTVFSGNIQTIYEGNSSASVYFNPVDDRLSNPARTATITASAAGFSPASQTVTVLDDDPASLAFDPVSGPATAGSSVNARVVFMTLEGKPATGFSDRVELSAANERGPAVFHNSYNYAYNGVLNASIVVDTASPHTRLHAETGAGVGGDSNEFTVLPAAAARLAWDPLPNPAQAGVPFSATIRASDRFGNPVAGFAGPAALSARQQAREGTSGTGTSTTEAPLNLYYARCRRTTSVVPADALDGPGMIQGLALNVSSANTGTTPHITIRIKHTDRANYAAPLSWENDGWTTVYTKATPVTATGWIGFPFTSPFVYDGTANLLVDICIASATAGYGDEVHVYGTPSYSTGGFTTITAATAETSPDPSEWTGAQYNPAQAYTAPNLRFAFGSAAAVSPATTTAFVDGAWTGAITIDTVDNAVILTASSATLGGDSAAFAIAAALPAPVPQAEPTWTAGSSNTISWAAVAAASGYQLQYADNPGFADAFTSGWTTSTRLGFVGLADGATYYFRVRAKAATDAGDAVSAWSNTVSSTQDAAAPVVTVTAPRITTSATVTLSGTTSDTSGVARVLVGNTPATSPDGFASWTCPVALHPGQNTLTIAATDHATPAQTTETTVAIVRLPSTEDTDGDSVPDLLEHAFGWDPATPGAQGLPTATLALNSADGLTYLTFTYRRRVQPEGLTYHVETATDLREWSAVATPEEVSVADTGDGITRTVTVRIPPAIEAGEPIRFVRLRVALQ